jgi:hypothetical protein
VSNFLGISAVESNGTMIYGTGLPAPGTFSGYLQNKMQSMDAGVLMDPLSYSSTQQANVTNFVHNLTGSLLLAISVPYSSYQTAYNNLSAQADPQVVNQSAEAIFTYLLGIDSLGSLLSIGLYDIQSIMGSRLNNPLTGTSAAYADKMMATRRLFNTSPTTDGTTPTNSWINDMQQASPLVLQRELVYLLAEMNYQLYQMRMMDEKILLTLAAMQIGSLPGLLPGATQPLTSIATNASSSTS